LNLSPLTPSTLAAEPTDMHESVRMMRLVDLNGYRLGI
jgi:hypothetical protein